MPVGLWGHEKGFAGEVVHAGPWGNGPWSHRWLRVGWGGGAWEPPEAAQHGHGLCGGCPDMPASGSALGGPTSLQRSCACDLYLRAVTQGQGRRLLTEAFVDWPALGFDNHLDSLDHLTRNISKQVIGFLG